MGEMSFARYFRLRPEGVECDAGGLRVGGVALLARDAKGAWTRRDQRDLNRELSKLYGFPLDFEGMSRRIDAVAAALSNGELARAQIGPLLLQLPAPPASAGAQPGGLEKRRLADDLVACGLLKADDDWEDKHPRTGAPPNPGWFAPTSGTTPVGEQETEAGPATGASSRGGEAPAFVPLSPAAGVGSLLAEDLSATALNGLATLAARFSIPTIFFGAIFIPSANALVDEGPVPGRPDMTYLWARDETQVTFKVLIDGQWRTIAVGALGPNDAFYNRDHEIVARMVLAPGRQPTLIASVDVLDNAIADLRRQDGEPAAAPTDDDGEPKLCPDPTPEPKTTNSANSIAYQEYVSGLPYGWAISVGGVIFDGCDPTTGNLLEAKALIDFMFDEDDELYSWIDPANDPEIQMKDQAEAALAVGRQVVWHAQTEKGYRGLKEIANGLPIGNLSVVFDPN